MFYCSAGTLVHLFSSSRGYSYFLQDSDDKYLRRNKIRGQYNDLDHYLDVQYRLLREDFVAPLRDGISDYIQALATAANQGKSKKNQDVRIYHNVKLISPYCADIGISHVLQFDVSKLQVRWQSSKRLIYGSLLCLSHDNFKTIVFATVTNRSVEELQKGLVHVRFELAHNAIVELWDRTFTMAETTAYFESYRHVLLGLQKIRPGDLPFEKYILKCDNQIQPPAYIRRNIGCEMDLRPLVDEDVILRDDSRLDNPGIEIAGQKNYDFSQRSKVAQNVTVLDRNTWPPADLLHLDTSQYEAIHTALTNEFVITQGPPGTGKTYIGLKIVKALLHNKDLWSVNSVTGAKDPRPMLVVCYTNHALDQFLEGIIQFYKGDLIRIGSRSQSEILKPYNLHNFRQRFRHEKTVPVQVFQARREAKSEMDSLEGKINIASNRIQIARTQILHEDFLQPFMGSEMYSRLTDQFEMMLQVYPEARKALPRSFSVIVEWLQLGNLSPIVEMEGNIPQELFENMQIPAVGENEQDVDLVDVEDEVDAIQAQRQLDDGYEWDSDELLDEFDIPISRKEVNERKVRHAVIEQMKAVALNVDSLTDRPKNLNQYEWQYQKKERKRLKVKTQRNLSSNDIMPEAGAQRFEDLWRMQLKDKWRLYRLWVKKYCDYLRSDITTTEEEYEAAAARHKEALLHEDKEIMRHSTVIGMTTTGAARYQSILQEIKPRIIVVEEAAEVLEAHIITTLSSGCEHLILIGDHKQLKPNPTVYELARTYNLDVSLFERMVTNGLRCDTLALQHRMRPKIAELMQHIYRGLRNHDSVLEYEDIKGVSTNMYFVDHKQWETHETDLKSHSNWHEANFVVAFCKYLLLQGYKPNQITILTMYSGQLFTLRNLMPKDRFDGVRVTVVDNYQGEENDIILLSLVRSNEDGSIGFLKVENRICVALSRAKKGLYIVGNFDLLATHSTLWNEIVIDMKSQNLLGEGLLLCCQNHPEEVGITASLQNDFDKAPEGGCSRKCTFRLECGHVCKMYCHILDKDHKDYECQKPCNKSLCENGHRCKRKCYQECGDCDVYMEKKLPKCGHIQMVPCHKDPSTFVCEERCAKALPCKHTCQNKCGKACTDKCRVNVEHTWPCGHAGKVLCYEKNTAPCPEPCGFVLECQHICSGTCGTCFEGRFHRPCRNYCSRILVCGHECNDRCNLCPPCTNKCENRCKHSKCGKRCGELCSPCMEPCEWKCQHFTCTSLCHEPCNRPRCNEPCRKRLTCGHECIGLCGEPCPNDCRECDKDKVTELLFGTEDEPDARFVLLEDCRNHCIVEYTAMDYYMDTKEENGEIQLKSCPRCKTPIRKSCRYGSIINKSLMEIEDVKKRILTNKDRIRNLEEDINIALIDEEDDIKQTMRRRLLQMKHPRSENALVSIKNQLTFLKSIKKLKQDWSKLKGVAVESERETGIHNLELFQEWALEDRSIMTSQETTDAELEIARSRDHLKILMYQKQLAERRTTVDYGFRNKVREAERVLTKGGKYTDEKKQEVRRIIEELNKILGGLGISEEERMEIVKAMALPKGHWFQCPQGKITSFYLSLTRISMQYHP